MTTFARFIYFAVFCSGSAKADWTTTDTQVRRGNSLQVVCNATAPIGAVDLARKEALQSCRSTAISNLQTDLIVKTLTIQTEREVALHSETKQYSSYKGMDCKQDKEKIQEDTNGGTVTVYLRCNFDLAKVKVTALDEPETKDNDASSSLVKNADVAKAIPTVAVGKPKSELEQSENRLLTISVVPSPCDEIIVRGRSRVIKCDQNPKALLLYPEDNELIVRLRGYKPKHIMLNRDRKPAASFEKEEELNVFLEKN